MVVHKVSHPSNLSSSSKSLPSLDLPGTAMVNYVDGMAPTLDENVLNTK